MLILAYSGFRFVYGTKATAAASTCICECVRAPMCFGVCVCVHGVSRMVSWFSHATTRLCTVSNNDKSCTNCCGSEKQQKQTLHNV